MKEIEKRPEGDQNGGWAVNVQGNINVTCPQCGNGQYLQTHGTYLDPEDNATKWNPEDRTEHYTVNIKGIVSPEFSCVCGFKEEIKLLNYAGEGK